MDDPAAETDGPIRLAVDAMGGYEAPGVVVEAVAEASAERHPARDVYFTLVGDESEITDQLVARSHNPERIQIHHAPARVSASESARDALRGDAATSIEVACELVASGRAEGVVTAGHPGAALLAGKEHLDRMPGVDRAPICAVFPTSREREPEDDRLSLLLDVGASHTADASDLLDYAVMGSAYAGIVTELDAPEVALLSSSSELEGSPPEVAEAARRLADDSRVDFGGTFEGHDIVGGEADVVVCNGYVGNVTIKVLEGVSEAAVDLARSAYDERLLWRVALRLLSDGLSQLKRLTDFEEYGGAPVLGLDGVLIVAHARSGRKAIGNAIRLALKNIKADLPERVRAAVAGDHTT